MLVYRHVGGRGLEHTSRKLRKGGTSIGSVLLLLMTGHAFFLCMIGYPHCPFTPMSGLLNLVSGPLTSVSSLLIPVSRRVCVLPAPMCVSSTLNGPKTVKTDCSSTRAHALYCHLHFSPAPSASSAGRRGRRGRSFHYSLLYTRA